LKYCFARVFSCDTEKEDFSYSIFLDYFLSNAVLTIVSGRPSILPLIQPCKFFSWCWINMLLYSG